MPTRARTILTRVAIFCCNKQLLNRQLLQIVITLYLTRNHFFFFFYKKRAEKIIKKCQPLIIIILYQHCSDNCFANIKTIYRRSQLSTVCSPTFFSNLSVFSLTQNSLNIKRRQIFFFYTYTSIGNYFYYYYSSVSSAL